MYIQPNILLRFNENTINKTKVGLINKMSKFVKNNRSKLHWVKTVLLYEYKLSSCTTCVVEV